jgi:hypothetical protein
VTLILAGAVLLATCFITGCGGGGGTSSSSNTGVEMVGQLFDGGMLIGASAGGPGEMNINYPNAYQIPSAYSIAVSKIELMKAAKRIGFRDARDANTGDARPKPILASATSLIKPADVIKKTVISNPTMTPPTAKPEKSERQAKKESASKDKKDRT